MLNAMTQGNDGSLSTIHANSSADVVHKIATYAIQAPERLPWEATVRLVASALDFIVFVRRRRTESGQRRVVESVREIAGVTEDGQLATNELWGLDDLGEPSRHHGRPGPLPGRPGVDGLATDRRAVVAMTSTVAPGRVHDRRRCRGAGCPGDAATGTRPAGLSRRVHGHALASR